MPSPLDTSRPYTKFARPGIGAPPRPEEGAGYIAGTRPGSYANRYAQPVNIDVIYAYTDGKFPDIAYAGRGQALVTYANGPDFFEAFLAPYGFVVPHNSTTAQALMVLGPYNSSTAIGQAQGWAWDVSTGGG